MLPITKIVLFQHGIGHFQRSGTVEGDQSLEMYFDIDQMNDLLKSLTVLDLDGGNISVLNYESEDPVEKQLADINIGIPEKRAISSFLDQLKGAGIKVAQPSGEISGMILGVEYFTIKAGDTTTVEPHLAILAEGNRLFRIPLLETREIIFSDEVIAEDLNKLLGIHRSSLHKNRRKLMVRTTGEGRRRISIGYVSEVPVWKTSYRIFVTDDGVNKPLLQGWALVDNTTEEDWVQVRLSLVSGLPVSFIHDLYSPRYRKRSVIEVDLDAGVSPITPERCLEAAQHESLSLSDFTAESTDDYCASLEDYSSSDIRQSIDVKAEAQDAGDYFIYDISLPVDIKRGNSAMVPILQADVEAERVLIYNPGARKKNPMAALHFKNSTGMTLEKGPITVFDKDCYSGEAMLDYIRKDDETYIPYMVELGVTVESKTSVVRESYHSAKKQNNWIRKEYLEKLITTYSVYTQLDHATILYLDHPSDSGSYPDDGAEHQPFEKTENFWRYKIELEPDSTFQIDVVEVRTYASSIEIPGITKEEVVSLFDGKLITRTDRNGLEKIASVVANRAELEELRDQKEIKLESIGDGQGRLRKNINVLGKTREEADLRRKYITKLMAEEEVIETLQEDLEQLEQKISEVQYEIEEMTENLKFDGIE